MRDHENTIRLFFTGHALLRMSFSVRCFSDDLKHIKTFKITVKELSICHKRRFSIPFIFSIQYRKHYIFQTMNFVRSNYLSLKYQSYTPSGCKDIGIRKFEFVAITQFLLKIKIRKYLKKILL